MRSISLIPPDSHLGKATVIPKNVLLLFTLVIAMVAGGTFYAYSLNTSIKKDKSATALSNASLQPVSLNVAKLSAKSSTVSGVDVTGLTNLVKQIVKERPSWASLIQQVYSDAAPNIQITSFSGQLPTGAASSTTSSSPSSSTGAAPGAFDISISGVATSQVAAVNFIQQLRSTPGIAQATLLSSNQVPPSPGQKGGVNFSAGLSLSSDGKQLVFSPAIGGASTAAPSATGGG